MKWIVLACLALVPALAACSSTSTKLESSWREPNAGPIQFEKVVVLAVLPEDSLRRSVEDAIARRVKGAIPGYTVVSELGDEQAVKSKVLASGADGGILVRLIGKRQETEWVPGAFPSTHSSPWGFYGSSRHAVVDPGYVRPGDEYVRFQTNIYDLEKEQLVWSGLTESVKPDSISGFVDELSEVVREALREEGLLPGS